MLPVYTFSKDSRKKDGLNYQCKSCRRQYDSQHYQNNNIRIKEQILEYQRQNRKRMRAINRRYTLAKAHRTPQWLTLEQRRQIINFYINCLEGMVVDHIYPLQGKYVSGLHHPDNLQYLTLKENCYKYNRCSDIDKLWE